ncbi:unnamed protein product, partial [Iphiclides podalirius]
MAQQPGIVTVGELLDEHAETEQDEKVVGACKSFGTRASSNHPLDSLGGFHRYERRSFWRKARTKCAKQAHICLAYLA